MNVVFSKLKNLPLIFNICCQPRYFVNWQHLRYTRKRDIDNKSPVAK